MRKYSLDLKPCEMSIECSRRVKVRECARKRIV